MRIWVKFRIRIRVRVRIGVGIRRGLRLKPQAKPCRCSRQVTSIIERIDLGCASNPMRVLICLTAADYERAVEQ